MKFLLLALSLAPVFAAGLPDVKAVYILPMSHGLDQYIAERITSRGLMLVLTDPKRADAILSDRIGGNFEESLQELYGEATVKKSDKIDDSPYQRPAMQPLTRGKGNIFLIDRQTKDVLWSTFVMPKTGDAHEVNDTADDIVKRLAKAHGAKK